MPVDEDNFPFDFDSLLERIDGGLILVLGEIDAGKTTLIKALHDRLGGKIIDGDVGQPEIGPPGLISVGTYREGMKDASFVGDITPRGNLVGVIAGIAKLACKTSGLCFIDTDGWVEGGAAGAYKNELIEVLEPDRLILLEKGDELEKFGSRLSKPEVIRLTTQESGKKSPGERAANRTRRFKYYFFRAKKCFKEWKEIKILGSLVGTDGRAELDKEGHRNRLVGCYRKFDFKCLGTISEVRREGIEIFAPSEDFDTLKLGKIKVEPSGRQIE